MKRSAQPLPIRPRSEQALLTSNNDLKEESIMLKSKSALLAVAALTVAVLAASPLGRAAATMVLPSNSVGTLQIKPAAVTGAKVKDGTLAPPTSRQPSCRQEPGAIPAPNVRRATPAQEGMSARRA
jgi:hypothetical protein